MVSHLISNVGDVDFEPFSIVGFTGSYSVFDIIALGLCNNVGVQFCPRRH